MSIERMRIAIFMPEASGGVTASSRRERDITTLFDRLFAPAHTFRPAAEGWWHPLTDIHEFEDRFLIRMDLAGVDPAAIEVMKEGRCLVVRGIRQEPRLRTPVACHQLEISYGAFERVICLPAEFRPESVHAEYAASGFFQITVVKE